MNKVLALDEDYSVLNVLSFELAEDGFEVVMTDDCQNFLGLIEEESPQLVIMEPKLKRCDGLCLLQTIRYRHYDLPIIIWTGSHQVRHDPRIMAADHHVLKSSDMKELRRKICMALEASERMPRLLNTPIFQKETNGMVKACPGLFRPGTTDCKGA